MRLGAVLALVGIALTASYLLMPQVEYLPSGTRNLAIGLLLPPPGYNIDQVLELGNRLEDATMPYWDVDLDDPDLAKLDAPAIADYSGIAWSPPVASTTLSDSSTRP